MFKMVFALAAILFIMKPFLGFSVLNGHLVLHHQHSIIVKAFSKRKPEELEEAKKRQAAIQRQLSNPPVQVLAAIACLLAFILPLLGSTFKLLRSRIDELSLRVLPSQPVYLLSGKLTI